MPKRSSGLDFSDGRLPNTNNNLEQHPDLADRGNGAVRLQRNHTERKRLQGLQRTLTNASSYLAPPTQRTFKEKFNVWLINEGGRRIFFGTWIFLHMLVIAFGFMNYNLKDNMVNARATFGITYRTWLPLFCAFTYSIIPLFRPAAIARSAALVLHVDVAFILLPVCRNFVSYLRRTPLNDIIPFDRNITFHKATAWSIVVFTVVHILAHMVNFYRLAMADTSATTTGQRVLAFLATNFTTGPGVTGWIMTACLGAMVYYAREKVRRATFERFWYSHHLFIIFFINWQLHGMFCMIKPDRPPYCSFNTIAVFWVTFFSFLALYPILNTTQTAVLARWRRHLDR